MKTVAVFGTFDTKGQEYKYLIEKLQERDVSVLSINLGLMADTPFPSNISVAEVVAAAGEEREGITQKYNRAECLDILSRGTVKICRHLFETDQINGIITMGGGQGTFIAGNVMREMPIGVPKLILSTSAAIPEAAPQFEGINDTLVMNSLLDISGLNPVLAIMIERAAAAMAGMMTAPTSIPTATKKSRIAISMWGVTTPCVTRVHEILTKKGYEVYVFHATGLGGRIMENLAEQGFFDGIVDLTLPELSIPIIGGEYSIIPFRLEKAAAAGIPLVVSVGGIDMVRFGYPFNLPEKFRDRPFYMHNPELMFVRSSAEENKVVGYEIAKRLNKAVGEACVILPIKGISAVDIKGNAMFDREADQALFQAIKENVKTDIPVYELAFHINDAQFADYVADTMLRLLKNC